MDLAKQDALYYHFADPWSSCPDAVCEEGVGEVSGSIIAPLRIENCSDAIRIGPETGKQYITASSEHSV